METLFIFFQCQLIVTVRDKPVIKRFLTWEDLRDGSVYTSERFPEHNRTANTWKHWEKVLIVLILKVLKVLVYKITKTKPKPVFEKNSSHDKS